MTLAAVAAWSVGGLEVDQHVDRSGQLALGVFTACVLAALLALQPAAVRLQTLAVVGIATLVRSSARSIWGLYTYRLENLPAFVPPGPRARLSRGLVARDAGGARPTDAPRGSRRGCVAAWGIAGVTVLPAPTSRARSAVRSSSASSCGRAAPYMPESSWWSSGSSSTAPRSERGRGSRSCRGSASLRETRRAALRAGTSCSTSLPSRWSRGSGASRRAVQSRKNEERLGA